jgi:anti-anti-sigma factor
VERTDADTCLVSPEGDLDMAASQRLRATLRRCWLGSAARLVVDLSKVDLLDAAAVRALLEGRDQMAARGGELQIVRPSAPARRVLEATGSLSAFSVSN